MSWVAPVFNGGSSIISYQLSSDGGLDGDQSVIVESLLSLDYVVTGLTQGLTYKFTVRARNALGLSVQSNIVAVIAA